MVGKAPLTISATSHSGLVYGDDPPIVTPLYGGFEMGEDASALSTPPTCSTTYTLGAPPDTYASTCAGAEAANYDITGVDGSVEVGKATLTISASEPSAQYSDPMPGLDAVYDGFLFDDGPGDLQGALDCISTVAVDADNHVVSPARSYLITCSGLASDRYAISWVDGWLTVEGEATITRLSADNPHAVPSTVKGGRATTPALTFTIDVTEEADGTYGDIGAVLPDMLAVVRAGDDLPVIGTCRVSGVRSSDGTQPGTATITCDVPARTALGVYSVTFQVGGGYYYGWDQSVLAVYDAKATGSSGGGTMVNPNTGADADFAYTVHSLAKGAAIEGWFLYLGRDAAGNVVQEIWSDTFSTLSVSGNRATATGTGRLWSPAWDAPIEGNALRHHEH